MLVLPEAEWSVIFRLPHLFVHLLLTFDANSSSTCFEIPDCKRQSYLMGTMKRGKR